MNKQWTMWVSVAAVAVVILFAFSYKSRTDSVPLSKIFSEELGDKSSPEYEYEFVNESGDTSAPIQPLAAAPAEAPMERMTANPPAASSQASISAQAASAQTAAPAALTATDGAFAIQVSAFRERARAEEALKKVQAAGHPAYVVTKQGSNGAWHKIYVGSYATKGEADASLGKLKAAYKDCFVIKTK